MTSFIEWIQSDTAGFVSVGMVGLSVVITLQNVFMHLVNYTRDDLQRHIVRIILVVPIYAIASICELQLPSATMITGAFVDFWEALVIYSFFNLVLEYVGGEHNWLVCVQHTHPEGLKHTWPFNLCFKPMDLDPKWLRNCKLACFQFVLIKPIFGLLMLPLLFTGYYHTAPWPVIRDIVYNITYTVAMYALALLYLTTHAHPSLKPKRPLAKFGTIKIVIFFTYWQRYLLVFFDLTTQQLDDLLAYLTLIEMTLVTIPLNWVAFPWKEFKTQIFDPNSDMNAVEMMEEGEQEQTKTKLKSVMGNAMKIFSPDDMVEHAEQNMRSKYKTHVLLESAQEYVIEDNPVGQAIQSPSPAAGGAGRRKKFRTRVANMIGKRRRGSDTSEVSSSCVADASPTAVSPIAIAEPPPIESSVLGETPPTSPSSKSLVTTRPTGPIPLLPMPPRPSAASSQRSSAYTSPAIGKERKFSIEDDDYASDEKSE